MLGLLVRWWNHGYRELIAESAAFQERSMEAERSQAELDAQLRKVKRRAGISDRDGEDGRVGQRESD